MTRATGTFTGDMVLPDGKVVAPTGKVFDVEFGQTVKWDGNLLVEISAFWDAALQARLIGLGKIVRSIGWLDSQATASNYVEQL